MQHEQGTDPVGVRGALMPQKFELAVRAPVVFLLRRGDAGHRPHASFAGLVAHQHGEQPVAVKPVRPGATGTPVHLDTGRIHHEIDDTLPGLASGAARSRRGLLRNSCRRGRRRRDGSAPWRSRWR